MSLKSDLLKGNILGGRSVETLRLTSTNRETMSLIGIYFVLVFFGSLQNGVVSTDWVDDLTRYIVEDSEFYQVKLMTRMADNETLTNPLIEELSVKLMQNLATVRINYDDDFKLPVDFGNDSSATLFILAIESSGSLPIPMTIKFIDVLVETTRYHEGSKYLVVSFARSSHDSLEELLEHAWKKKLLEFTVIELLETRGSRSSIEINRASAPPIIHRLNPFEGKYSKTKSPLNKKNLFPDKLRDMKGYNLTIMDTPYWEPNDYEPFSWTLRTRILMPIIEKLNFDRNYLILHPGNGTTTLSDIEYYDIDFSTMFFPYFYQEFTDEQRSVPVKIDRFCPLVPIRFKKESVPLTELIKAYALSLAVVMIFWIFMRLLRINSYTSRMFNIARLFFGISVTQQPRIAVERIIFTCLLLIFAAYSSLVYGTITDMAFGRTVEIEYKNFKELDNSGLTPYIKDIDYTRASTIFDHELKTLGSKLVKGTGIFNCILLGNDQPVVCFTDRSSANGFMSHEKMKWTKMCFWDEHFSFIFAKSSPYRSKFNKLIMRLQSSGIAEEFGPSKRHKKIQSELAENIEMMNPLPQLLAICVVGYSLSIILFIAEIIYHRVSLYVKSKRRPKLPPPFLYCE